MSSLEEKMKIKLSSGADISFCYWNSTHPFLYPLLANSEWKNVSTPIFFSVCLSLYRFNTYSLFASINNSSRISQQNYKVVMSQTDTICSTVLPCDLWPGPVQRLCFLNNVQAHQCNKNTHMLVHYLTWKIKSIQHLNSHCTIKIWFHFFFY